MAISVERLVLQGLRSLAVAPPPGTGGTVAAVYCYSVFLRHRVMAAQYGLAAQPLSVVELGPGDSLGTGLMALLTGAKRYVAIDAVRHASPSTNLAVLDELVRLISQRLPIPSDGVCADIRPELGSYGFPHQIFDDSTLAQALAPQRIESIRRSLSNGGQGEMIRYLAPLGAMNEIKTESIDWIFSQAVMEHVDVPSETYAQCYRCLKPGGVMTHQIDYRCHETAPEWNGHWKYPQWLWSLMRGRRPWFVNRLAHSQHRRMQQEAGFEICAQILQTEQGGIARSQLARRFRGMSDEDFVTAGAFFVSAKKSAR